MVGKGRKRENGKKCKRFLKPGRGGRTDATLSSGM